MTQPLRYEKRDGIACLTLDRPEMHNALSPEMMCRLADAWEDFTNDDAMRVAIITGSGAKAFTAGADLKLTIPLLSGARSPADAWDHRFLSETDRLHRVTALRDSQILKPIVAAINGMAIGAGFEMLLGMDIRIAADNASFAVPEVTMGFMPGGASSVRLSRQISHCKAMELLLTGSSIDAQEAWRIGLINEVVPQAQLMPRAREIAQRIVRNSPSAIRHTKDTVLRTSGLDLVEAYAIEADNFQKSIRSEDAIEGPKAFSERREPRFSGK